MNSPLISIPHGDQASKLLEKINANDFNNKLYAKKEIESYARVNNRQRDYEYDGYSSKRKDRVKFILFNLDT